MLTIASAVHKDLGGRYFSARAASAIRLRHSPPPDPCSKPSHSESTIMLGSESSWLTNCDVGQLDCFLDGACTDGGDMWAGFDLSSLAQEPGTISTSQTNDRQQSLWFDGNALSTNQSIDFASFFTDADLSTPLPSLTPAIINQSVRSLPAHYSHDSAHQEIDTGLFYHNAQSPPIHQYINPAAVNQCANVYDPSAALSMQQVPDSSLGEDVGRSFLEEAPCALALGAGLVTESATELGTQPRPQIENSDEGPQLECEQLQQDQRLDLIGALADTRKKVNKQEERIRELEQACSEFPQMSVPIP